MPAIRHEIVGPADSPHRLRIAHLSDFHLWFSDRKLHEIERLLAPWAPDVLALTGDYADTPRGRRLAAEWMVKMAATFPVCWVAGNHDTYLGRSFVQTLESLPVLHAIDRRDAFINGKSGRAYRFTALDRLAQPASGGDADLPTVILLHNPADIDAERLPRDRNHLLLAGHLHGGQITLWRDRRGRPQPATFFFPRLMDLGTLGTTPLIVSRGLGDTWPVRFRAPTEIVMVDFAG